MPRGRHRHSPPLHRLLPPSVIAGVSLVCALGPWVFTQQTTLRGLAAAAAATAIVGAVVMRRWDMQAGKHVADLTRARASDEWRYEERVAELESDLDESRELRVKLEQRLRAKRAELAGLRNEHAALLRRYATAETERASALEGRRLLEIEAVPALPGAPASEAAADSAAEAPGIVEAPGTGEGAGAAESAEVDGAVAADSAVAADGTAAAEPRGDAAPFSTVFSPEGSKLFLRAQAALARLDTDVVEAGKDEDLAGDLAADPSGEEPARAASGEHGVADDANAAQEDEAQGKPEAVDEHAHATALHPAADTETSHDAEASQDVETPQGDRAPHDTAPGIALETARPGALADAPEADAPEADAPEAVSSRGESDAARTASQPEPPLDPEPGAAPAPTAPAAVEAAAAGAAGTFVPRPATSVRAPSGHFAVPTAVAVVPAAQPLRRRTAEGGFDFFGTKSESAPDALEAVQNEDLADVVGQEALALHKAESEAEFKPADEASRGVGQVIDLTAHDETEQIDLQQLRSAVS
ncbi:hypothetical protein [Streptomyces sp. NBC_00199]|uniref:hypothetical protein n=1 Tax=Streptomyces sp. NBC_00199 TaxID=2975678 RepID=UPI0022500847|nr:hypothetical protein [Streptomyces sp. NBC_00199]MCX5267277.1 hypothetical protein [Streptomyces sp. NBC_00199]